VESGEHFYLLVAGLLPVRINRRRDATKAAGIISVMSAGGRKCLQRVITVSSANAEQALEKAKREFEQLENVPNWKCHAQFLEVESTPSPDRAYPAARLAM
jgi:hypothetical protein